MIITVLLVLQKIIGYIYLLKYSYIFMYICACVYIFMYDNNNNAKIMVFNLRFFVYECMRVCIYVRWYDQGEREFCRFDKSFKRLKNLVERPAVLRRDRGKKEERNCRVWRVCQSGRVKRGRKFEIQGRVWRYILEGNYR